MGQDDGGDHQPPTANRGTIAGYPAAELPGEHPRQVIGPVQRIPAFPAVHLPELVAEFDARPPCLLFKEEDSAVPDHDEINVVPARATQLTTGDDMPGGREVAGEGLGCLPLAGTLIVPHYGQFGHVHTS